MCDETVDDSLAALQLLPDWFIPKLYAVLCADNG